MTRVRTRLTPQEREARRRARSRHSFSDAAYEHYDTSGGFGSAREWAEAAEDMAAGRGYRRETPPRAGGRVDPDLELLGLTELPDHVDALKRAFRKAAMAAHPDHQPGHWDDENRVWVSEGGDTAFKAVMAAYARLVRNY